MYSYSAFLLRSKLMDRSFRALACLVLAAVWTTIWTTTPRAAPVEALGENAHPRIEGLADAYWYRSDHAYIIARAPIDADSVAAEIAAAVDALETHFGRSAGRGAVVDLALTPQRPIGAALGVEWWLPWTFPAEDAGSPSAAAAAMAAMISKKPLAHEIMHRLFQTYVWPGRTDPDAYGSPAPDWLDEAAAMLAESLSLTRDRRTSFRRLVEQKRLIPLREYLAMEHPVMASQKLKALRREQMRSETAAPKVVFLTGEDAQALLSGARAEFYPQTRGFLDFLLERTGHTKFLLDITETLQSGKALEDWLARSKSESGDAAALWDTLEALERDFLQWAKSPM